MAWGTRAYEAERLFQIESGMPVIFEDVDEMMVKVFLMDGEVPIDDSASERALRNFTIDRKNWMTINTVRGAQTSAVIYSITETARANGLNVYYYKYRRGKIILLCKRQGNRYTSLSD